MADPLEVGFYNVVSPGIRITTCEREEAQLAPEVSEQGAYPAIRIGGLQAGYVGFCCSIGSPFKVGASRSRSFPGIPDASIIAQIGANSRSDGTRITLEVAFIDGIEAVV